MPEGGEMYNFDIDDYLSLYLADWQRQWVIKHFNWNRDIGPWFERYCVNKENVCVTPNSVYIARFLLEHKGLLVFPWIDSYRSLHLNQGNWKMYLLQDPEIHDIFTTYVSSKLSIALVVNYIKEGVDLQLVPEDPITPKNYVLVR